MTGGEVAGLDLAENLGFELQQTQTVADGGACLADAEGDVVLRHVEFSRQAAVGAGLFHRVEVLALDILDDRQLQGLAVVDVAHHHRDGGQAGQLGGAETPLAGDQLIVGAVCGAPYQ